MIDPILIGDNPFIGVNHLSSEKGRVSAEKFSNEQQVVDILDYASDLGIRGFVASTHPNLRNVVNYITKNTHLADKINLYPILPYAQGYVIKMTEKGIIGAANDILSPASLKEKAGLFIRGGMGILKKDVYALSKILVDVELLPLKKMNIKAVFLHDVFTDLALAMKSKEAFEIFSGHIKDKYNAVPGFVTKNFARLVNQINEWNLDIPLIMTHFNKVGFQMNPSREECEKALENYKGEVIAMATLASGYLKPKEAFEYIFELPKIKSVVVGVSTKHHAKETFEMLKGHFNYAQAN